MVVAMMTRPMPSACRWKSRSPASNLTSASSMICSSTSRTPTSPCMAGRDSMTARAPRASSSLNLAMDAPPTSAQAIRRIGRDQGRGAADGARRQARRRHGPDPAAARREAITARREREEADDGGAAERREDIAAPPSRCRRRVRARARRRVGEIAQREERAEPRAARRPRPRARRQGTVLAATVPAKITSGPSALRVGVEEGQAGLGRVDRARGDLRVVLGRAGQPVRRGLAATRARA